MCFVWVIISFSTSYTPKIEDQCQIRSREIRNLIPNFEAICKIAYDARIPVIVDNTDNGGYLIKSIEHGAKSVVHSNEMDWSWNNNRWCSN
ncbi:unnamed protein product [Rhizophagus irregularis]|nr:unnamed protein product [Rhizophagus irregularis]